MHLFKNMYISFIKTSFHITYASFIRSTTNSSWDFQLEWKSDDVYPDEKIVQTIKLISLNKGRYGMTIWLKKLC